MPRSFHKIERMLPHRDHHTIYHDYFVGRVEEISATGELRVVDPWDQVLHVTLREAELLDVNQPFGPECLDYLERLVLSQTVYIAWNYIPNKHYVSSMQVRAPVLTSNHECVDDLLVQNGLAYATNPDRSRINGYQAFAQSQGYGLWSDMAAVPPAIWRKMRGSAFWSWYYPNKLKMLGHY